MKEMVAPTIARVPRQGVIALTVAPQPDHVRQVVAQTFEEYGVHLASLNDLDEVLVVNLGRYIARTYRAGSLMAMWLVRLGIVQFYDRDGTMLRTINLFRELKPERMAA